jgi:hypothetical protein
MSPKLRRFLSYGLAILAAATLLALALAACGSSAPSPDSIPGVSQPESSAPTEAPQATEAPAATTAPEPTAVQLPEVKTDAKGRILPEGPVPAPGWFDVQVMDMVTGNEGWYSLPDGRYTKFRLDTGIAGPVMLAYDPTVSVVTAEIGTLDPETGQVYYSVTHDAMEVFRIVGADGYYSVFPQGGAALHNAEPKLAE